MVQALNRNPDGSPKSLLRTVRRDVNDFVGSAPQFDDITMLALKYRSPEN